VLENAWTTIKDARIPALCEHPAAKLQDGIDHNVVHGLFELNRRLNSGWPALVSDIPSDAGPLIAVVATCNAGGVSWAHQILLFTSTGAFYASTDLSGPISDDHLVVWESEGLDGPARDGVLTITSDGSELRAEVLADTGETPLCCPAGAAIVTFHPAHHRVIIDRVRSVPAGS
jgi:hypothetical protein